MHPLPIFDSSIYGDDCMTSGREFSHWNCAHEKEIIFPYGPDSWKICSCMVGMGRYLLELCTLEGVPFDYTMESSANTSHIFCEPHGHLWLLEDGQNCLGTWDSHPCHCKNIIVRFNVDVHQAHKELYVGWGNQIDFQFCIDNFQFSVQWYDSHIMNIISSDDKSLWWILMVEEMGSMHNFV